MGNAHSFAMLLSIASYYRISKVDVVCIVSHRLVSELCLQAPEYLSICKIFVNLHSSIEVLNEY